MELLLAALAFANSPLALACDTSASPVQGEQPAADEAAAEAKELWQRACAATLLSTRKNAQPITALDLSFELLTRGDQGSQELRPRVRWLADNNIALQLASGREQVRGPDGDWFREGQEVRKLQGREYAEDRRQTDDYLTIVKNFVALAHPKSLAVENLTLVKEPPFEFPRRHALDLARNRKNIQWLRFDSAALQLAPGDDWGGAPPIKHRIHVAIDTTTAFPVMAFVESGDQKLPPMFLSLGRPAVIDDLRIPHQVHVYPIRSGGTLSKSRGLIAESPSQELYIRGGTIRAQLREADFKLPK